MNIREIIDNEWNIKVLHGATVPQRNAHDIECVTLELSHSDGRKIQLIVVTDCNGKAVVLC